MFKKIRKQVFVIFMSLIFSVSCLLTGGGLTIFASIKSSVSLAITESLVEEDDETLNVANTTALAIVRADDSCVYLSDIDYKADQSFSLQGFPITYDKTNNHNTKIKVKIEGNWYEFEKGICSIPDATIVYDISGYNYKYFTAYVGLDYLVANLNTDGVKFYIYTSADGENWTLKTEENPEVILRNTEAKFVSVDIMGACYLKLVVDKNGSFNNDWSVWADAKLTNSPKETCPYVLEDYDKEIETKDTDNGVNNSDLELLVLQREFVRRVGNYALTKFYNENESNVEMLNWLLTNREVLQEYIMGGTPSNGNYYKSLTVLSNLYRNYKTDLTNAKSSEKLGNQWQQDRTYGQLFRTMMFSIALTHDGRVSSWMQPTADENQSDPLRRYAIYRYLYTHDCFDANKNSPAGQERVWPNSTMDWFGSLRVEEMRFVMGNIIDDESILWLNDYVQTQMQDHPSTWQKYHWPHVYIAYTWPNYSNSIYYAEENKDYFNNLFAVYDRTTGQKVGLWDMTYTIPGGIDEGIENYTIKITRGTSDYKLYKVWMNFRNKFNTGAVCGGISKSGTNIRAARGIPSMVVGQPGHAAILGYLKNSSGQGYWMLDNDVSGWTASTKGDRHLLGWGNQAWQRTHSTVVYFHLAQDALNDYENYTKAEENVMLAKAFAENPAKQIDLYEKALTIQGINLDAWQGVIESYVASGNKTETDFIALAKRIADKMVGYPLPMYNLLNNLIKPNITTTAGLAEYTMIENKALNASKNLPNNATDKTLMPSVARTEANFLLGQVDTTIATFSFTGDDAGKIVLSERFTQSGVSFKYSLDGKQTWSDWVDFEANAKDNAPPHKHPLTQDELKKINETDDIYILIKGLAEDNYYKIEISQPPQLPTTLYGNDWENKIIGINNDTYEWRYRIKRLIDSTGAYEYVDSDEDYISFSEQEPDLSGDKSIEIRIKATGGKPASASQVFDFTENIDNAKRKYVSVSHYTIEGFSTQSVDNKRPNYAINAIDGNGNTYWHTDYGENILSSGNTPYIIIKLDEARYISGIEFVQYQAPKSGNIFAKNARVLVSVDGEHWTEAGRLENIEQLEDLKLVNLERSVYGQYVKLEMDTYGIFTTLSLVNIYEDTTQDNPETPVPPKDNIAKKVIPIIVVVLIIVCGCVFAVWYKKHKDNDNKPDGNNKNKNNKKKKVKKKTATSIRTTSKAVVAKNNTSNKDLPSKSAPTKTAKTKQTQTKPATNKNKKINPIAKPVASKNNKVTAKRISSKKETSKPATKPTVNKTTTKPVQTKSAVNKTPSKKLTTKPAQSKNTINKTAKSKK